MSDNPVKNGTTDSNGNGNLVRADSNRVEYPFGKWDKELEDHDAANKTKLYNEFKNILSRDADNFEILWRMAKVSLILSAAAEK